MKATGIVRRIDDLGRVVIPKEIRRTMRIREGDPLEIYTSKDGEVIFKKYSLMGGVDEFAAQLCDTLSKSTGTSVAVTDRTSANGRSSKLNWLKLYPDSGFTRPDTFTLIFKIFSLLIGSFFMKLRMSLHNSFIPSIEFSNL